MLYVLGVSHTVNIPAVAVMVPVGPVVLDLADMGYEAIEMVQDFVLVAPLCFDLFQENAHNFCTHKKRTNCSNQYLKHGSPILFNQIDLWVRQFQMID